MNEIDETVKIYGDVNIGRGNKILPYSILIGPLEIGDNNIIGPYALIGSPGQDTKEPRHDSSEKLIKIGSNNIIREFVSIGKPTYKDITCIGNNCFFMHGCRIPHDAIIEDNVTIANLVVLSGMTHVMKGANIANGSLVHQYSVVGSYSIVGMGSCVVKNIRPFVKHVPGKPGKVNYYAIKKFNLNDCLEEIEGYVVNGEVPSSGLVFDVVSRFNELHLDSGRGLY